MKIFTLIICLFIFFTTKSYSHSGGTDSNGCHAGSQPYHCHNGGSSNGGRGGIDLDFWDFSLGYQYDFDDVEFSPYVGFSIGKSDHHDDNSIGFNFGFKHQDGVYFGYVTSSKSLQVGYDFLHFSANPESIGLGIRWMFKDSGFDSQSNIYANGSVFFSDEEN